MSLAEAPFQAGPQGLWHPKRAKKESARHAWRGTPKLSSESLSAQAPGLMDPGVFQASNTTRISGLRPRRSRSRAATAGGPGHTRRLPAYQVSLTPRQASLLPVESEAQSGGAAFLLSLVEAAAEDRRGNDDLLNLQRASGYRPASAIP